MHYNSIFISDLHLGTKKSKTKRLLQFLQINTCDNLFLVGDMIDGWCLQRKKHYWSKNHTEVIRLILKISLTCKVYYLSGNHDNFIRVFSKHDLEFGNLTILDKFVYSALDGRKILVIHGDHEDIWRFFPQVIINVLATVIDLFDLHDRLEKNKDRGLFSSSAIERRLTIKNTYDSIICGHTHIPKLTEKYMNCGDWVNECTSIVEHEDGKWELIKVPPLEKLNERNTNI